MADKRVIAGNRPNRAACALLKTSIYSVVIAEACTEISPRRRRFPCRTDTLRRRCLTGKDGSFWQSRKRPDERISLQQFRWFNAERQISWQPRNKVEVSEADRATSQTILKGPARREKKAANNPTAVNSAFGVVRAGLAASGPALFSQLLQVPRPTSRIVGRTAEPY
jgi:hypothetical protein